MDGQHELLGPSGVGGRTDRRRLLAQAGGALAAGAGMALLPPSTAGAEAPDAALLDFDHGTPTVRVRPDDPRYYTLSRGFNERWVGQPAYIEVVSDTSQVVRASSRSALRTTRDRALRRPLL